MKEGDDDDDVAVVIIRGSEMIPFKKINNKHEREQCIMHNAHMGNGAIIGVRTRLI